MISIIIPSRNRSALVARALAGIQAQSHADYEVILVDDSSNELTQQAYQEIWHGLDGRYKLIQVGAPAPAGLGPSITRNLGIRASQGEVVAFCDDDDFWCDPEHLARLAQAFASSPALDIYIGNQRAVDVDGHIRQDWLPGLSAQLAGRAGSTQGTVIVNCDDLCRSGGFAHLNILSLRKSLVEKIQGFWERISYEEDRDFFWRAVDAATTIGFNPTVIAQHNVPDPRARLNLSTAHSISERLLFSVLVSQHILANVRQRPITQLAGRYCGDLLRRLSLAARDAEQPHAALQFGCQALAARFSVKWAAYLLILTVTSLFSRRRT